MDDETRRRESLLLPHQVPVGNPHKSYPTCEALREGITLIIKQHMKTNDHKKSGATSRINKKVHAFVRQQAYVLLDFNDTLPNGGGWETVPRERAKDIIDKKTAGRRDTLAGWRCKEQVRQLDDTEEDEELFPWAIPVDIDEFGYSNDGTEWLDELLCEKLVLCEEFLEAEGGHNMVHMTLYVELESGEIAKKNLWDVFVENKARLAFVQWESFEPTQEDHENRWGKWKRLDWYDPKDFKLIEECVQQRFWDCLEKEQEKAWAVQDETERTDTAAKTGNQTQQDQEVAESEELEDDDSTEEEDADPTEDAANEYSGMTKDALVVLHNDLLQELETVKADVDELFGDLAPLPQTINPKGRRFQGICEDDQELLQKLEQLVNLKKQQIEVSRAIRVRRVVPSQP